MIHPNLKQKSYVYYTNLAQAQLLGSDGIGLNQIYQTFEQ